LNITVFGSGYVGLIQGLGLASVGNQVAIGDVSLEKIETLKSGKATFYEPGIQDLLNSAISSKTISFFHVDDTEFQEHIIKSRFIFLAVGTPQSDDGSTDLSQIESCVEYLCKLNSDLTNTIVATKSTVPVSTGDFIETMFRKSGKFPVVASNPEFLKQGAAVTDFMKPDRVVVGTDDSLVRDQFFNLYWPFVQRTNRIVFMGRRSAELVKYASNAFLATKISFINEISRLAEAYEANIHEVRVGMTLDSRIGDQFLYPGVGYGGSCFPKDTRSLISQAKTKDLALEICQATDNVNEVQKLWFFRKLSSAFSNQFNSKVVSFWGLSFKPNTDDTREAPSVYNIKKLLETDIQAVHIFDPQVNMKALQAELNDRRIVYFSNRYDCLIGSDALLLCTEWSCFKTPDYDLIRSQMRTPAILDGRLIYDKKTVESHGIKYYGVGLP